MTIFRPAQEIDLRAVYEVFYQAAPAILVAEARGFTARLGKNNRLPTLRPTNKVTYFRIATTDEHQGPAGADYAYKTLHLTRTYVIDDTETYGAGIANEFIKEFTAVGGTILGHASEPATTTSYVSLLTAIATKHPDMIYFGGNDSTGGILIRQQ